MAFNLKEILKFLIPEWQIIEIVKEKGFIARPNKDKQKTNLQQNTKLQVQGLSSQSSYSLQPKIASSIQTGSNQSTQDRVTLKPDNDEISEIFNEIRIEMGNYIIGQANYLDQLCVAFKRPFITGSDSVKPKNVIIILGDKSTGKKTSLSHMAQLLKEKKLASHNSLLSIKLSMYPAVSDMNLFLSDLYKSLYGQSDVILFEEFEKCHPSIIDVITALATTGKYTLGSRYIYQNNNLIEATGMLLQNSISEINANGKYFIFTSEKSEKDVYHTFGTKFMESVGDLISTEAFSNHDLSSLSYRILDQFVNKCSRNLSISITYDPAIVSVITASYRHSTGVKGMVDFVEQYLYKPLAEYKLRETISRTQGIAISTVDDELSAQIDGRWIKLSDMLPKKHSSNLDDIKRELENVIGLESVKEYVLSLEENMKVQRIRAEAGFNTSNVSMHMIFTGNPGTGKTTIARLVARYLKALGILSTGQLREVTRADLVGQYVGHTAKITNDVIQSALGGILFIDEAYSLCRDKHDVFGLEAIDTLVKGMEDYRDDLVVILAGYKDEMTQFLKSNSGLVSRFPNVINFEDYTSEEMYQISHITAKTKGYKIADDCKEPLIKLYDQKQIKGKNDSGNGRLVRNIIEGAILNQSKRLLNDPTTQIDLLTYTDFKFAEIGKFDLETSLSQIIGLDEVKEFVRTQYKLLIAQEKRKKAGISVDTTQSLNMIFSGNPGTGKTTIARVVANMFKEMGLLKSGHLVETDRGGLVAEYVGQTAKKTEETFKSAIGGVLFIDEAYALASDGQSFGKEAIDTLVKLIEDYRGEIIVILAGYEKEMTDFLKSNSGLESRFPLKINFPDYSAQELFQIALKMVSAKGFVLTEEANSILYDEIVLLHKQSNAHSGNGRLVRNYLDEITRNQSARIATHDVPVEEMNVISSVDIVKKGSLDHEFDLERELAKIIGLEEVKNTMRSLNARLRMQNERKKMGLEVDTTQTLHMIFKGNPGTGKTMVARTVAQLLYHIGVISTNKLVESDRADLVAGYIGQTAIKTREKVLEAMDGVLFIDEAYSLYQGVANDFGKEAIDTIVKLMDDYRDRIVIILAGYSQDMEDFLSVNPGLRSRFPNIIEFEDYTIDQLMQISEKFFSSKGYVLERSAKSKLQSIFAIVKGDPQFGNGRYVRNLYEKAINNQAMRLSNVIDLTREDLITIVESDIERV